MKSKLVHTEKTIIKLDIDFEHLVQNKVLVQQLQLDLTEKQATDFNQVWCQNAFIEGSIQFRNLENRGAVQILQLDIKQDIFLNFLTNQSIILFEVFNSKSKISQQKGIKRIDNNDLIELNAHSELRLIVFEGIEFKQKIGPILPLNYSIYKTFETIFTQSQSDFCYKVSLTRHIYHLIALLNEKVLKSANQINLSQMDLNSLIKLEYIITKSEDFNKTNFSIQHWAEEANMCPTKFKKAFRNLFGESPYQYFQHHRMDVAHKLITQKKLTVSETAYQTGYNSIGRFSMAFQEYFGIMPSRVK
jgi:AraC-like DNA-binding protein